MSDTKLNGSPSTGEPASTENGQTEVVDAASAAPADEPAVPGDVTPETIHRASQEALAGFVLALRQHKYRAGGQFEPGALHAKLDRLSLQLNALIEHLGNCGLSLPAYELLVGLRATELTNALQNGPRIQTLN